MGQVLPPPCRTNTYCAVLLFWLWGGGALTLDFCPLRALPHRVHQSNHYLRRVLFNGHWRTLRWHPRLIFMKSIVSETALLFSQHFAFAVIINTLNRHFALQQLTNENDLSEGREQSAVLKQEAAAQIYISSCYIVSSFMCLPRRTATPANHSGRLLKAVFCL